MSTIDDAFRSAKPSNEPTDLYRYYDHHGRLIYVGVSKQAVVRAMQHERTAHWWDAWASMTRETFPTRDAALDAERTAIRNERPLFNIVHAAWQKAG